MDNRMKIVTISFACFLIIPLLIWLVFSVFSPGVSTGIRFLVVPDRTTVSYTGSSKSVNYGDSVAFEPGEYTLTLSKNGFESEEKAVIVKSGEVSNLCVSLTANNEAGEKVLSEQKDLAARSEGVFGCQVEQGGEELEQSYPFIEKLPVLDKYFSATACREDLNNKESDYIICVSMVILNDFHKKRAKSILEDAGVDVNSTKIRFLEPFRH